MSGLLLDNLGRLWVCNVLISFTEPLCLFLQEQISNWKEQCEDLKKKGPELHGMHGRLSRKKAKV